MVSLHVSQGNVLLLTFEIVSDVLEAELCQVGHSGKGPLRILNDAVCAVRVRCEAGLGWVLERNGCAPVTSHWLLHPAQIHFFR